MDSNCSDVSEEEHLRLRAREGFKEESLFELNLEKQPGLGRGCWEGVWTRLKGSSTPSLGALELLESRSWSHSRLYPQGGSTEPPTPEARAALSNFCISPGWGTDYQSLSALRPPSPSLFSVLFHVPTPGSSRTNPRGHYAPSPPEAPSALLGAAAETLGQCHAFSWPRKSPDAAAKSVLRSRPTSRQRGGDRASAPGTQSLLWTSRSNLGRKARPRPG